MVVTAQPSRAGSPSHRFPSATVRAFDGTLTACKGGFPAGRVPRPTDFSDASWGQVRATLTALDLASENLEPTVMMRRLVRRELTLLAVVESAYGKAAIDSVADGDLDAVRSMLAIDGHTLNRFVAFVRHALGQAGRMSSNPPRRPRPRRRAPSGSNVASSALAERLLSDETTKLLEHLDRAIDRGDLDAAERIQSMYHRSVTVAVELGTFDT